ncbi:MAG: VCBS repeat-containing protein [Acidobacteria bacterium]|nr:VCBS repeat-containing protein [Acidobacteriota bacterium]
MGSHFQAQETCTEFSGFFTENFNTTDYKDTINSSVSDWPNGPVSLNYLGANFQVTEPSGMGARIYVCDAGDFDGDGKPDLIGLDIGNNNRLILIRNYYEDRNGDNVDDDGVIFQIDTREVYDTGMTCGPATITTADYNNDGLMDFFFMKNNSDQFGYSGFVAAMYINRGNARNPNFRRYNQSPNLNFTSRFQQAGIYINWAADHLCSVDIDSDGDVDVLAISQDKIFLIRNPGEDNFNLNNFEISELNYDQRTGFTTGRGGSSVDAGDFDGDGDVDVIGGTVNDYHYLVYYDNDGTGNFVRYELAIPNDEATGTVATCVADFNQDGRLDIFGATDRWNAGNEAHMWIFKNLGVGVSMPVNWSFNCLNNCQAILPDPHDVDMSASLDYDGDGDMDIILADANNSGDYYLVRNEIASVYALQAEARSTNVVGDLDPERYAVTKVTVSRLQMGWTGRSRVGLSIDLFVSNNGSEWDLYDTYLENELTNYTNLHQHSFLHFGTQLYWRAVLNAQEDVMAEYDDASYDTPLLSEIQLEYVFVERREYSRTSVAAASFYDDDSNRKKVLIGASFYYPGWQGQLRAYDITSMSSTSSASSQIETITRPDITSETGREIVAENVDILWDAGELLNNRSAADRVIYTAVPSSGVRRSRLDFTTSNAGVLGPLLQDYNNNTSGLIDFIRGDGRDWKLGDINHSNPVVVGPPSGNASLKGDGYADFAETWEDREKYVYVGANDGMIHCFSVETGEEKWAFVPYNLLPKLRNMWGVDAATGARYFSRDEYVDSTPSVEDVYIDADGDRNQEWITMLVCGQGPGQGSTLAGGTTGNFYFALDITNPDDPQPIWEYTHSSMGETYSVPAIGKISYRGNITWAVFMGSGYDNIVGGGVQGHRFFTLRADDARLIYNFTVGNVNTRRRWSNGVDLSRSLPGSPSIVDTDNDGDADRVYIGDTEGRLWKIDVSDNLRRASDWKRKTIYTDRDNYPIITKPAVWMDASVDGSPPRIYFGTGGDDNAPNDGLYSFIALIDYGNNEEVEWFVGDADNLRLDEDLDKGDLAAGEKIWADPQVANNVVYFSTLFGSIESVDPCENLAGEGKLYGRYVKQIGGSIVGSSSFAGSSGTTLEHLDLEIKTRAAVTIGEQSGTGGTRTQEVFIQEYDSTIQQLKLPAGAVLKVRSWREVYRIIKK